MFDNRALKKLIIPLIIEQTLMVCIGLTDIIMIKSAGEAAVSGIANVDAINVLLLGLFTALANGGSIVSAQYIGRNDNKNASLAAKQLIFTMAFFSLVITVLCLIFNQQIIQSIYGNIDQNMYDASVTYFYLTTLSYPFMALYSGATALFRAMGNTKVSLFNSILLNVFNISFNLLFIHGFGWGVTGTGLATLTSRFLVTIIVLKLLYNPQIPINIVSIFKAKLIPSMIKTILKVGVPSGFENSLFQIGKIMLQGLVNTFGLAAITANSISGQVATFAVIPGSAIGMALITVVGQSVGAGQKEEAKACTKKLMRIAFIIMFIYNLVIALLSRPISAYFGFSDDITTTATYIILFHSIAAMIIWVPSFTLPNAFRATGDVKFPMTVAITTMWVCRIGLAYFLAGVMNFGVYGVWCGMFFDWFVRAIIFVVHFAKGKWLNKKLLRD